MAVSQYLRPGSLLDSLTSCFTPGAVKGASSLIGAPEPSTRIAMYTAGPAVFAGMADMVSTGEGAKSLFSMIQNSGYHALVDDSTGLFRGGGTPSEILGAGRQMTDRLFGQGGAAAAETVSKASGIGQAPASTVLSLVAPLAMGVLEKEITFRGLDASGLRSLLLDQKRDFAAALPPKGPQMVESRPEAAVRSSESSLESNLSKWLAAWLIALLAVCVFLWVRSGTLEGGSGIAGHPAAQGTTGTR